MGRTSDDRSAVQRTPAPVRRSPDGRPDGQPSGPSLAILPSPVMVGRTAELSVLTDALESAASGRGGTVVLTGEAGVGKSRLLAELQRIAGECGVAVLSGRGKESPAPIAFGPVSEALLRALHVGPGEEDPLITPFRAALGHVVPEWSVGTAPTGGQVVSLLHVAEGFLRVAISCAGDRGTVVLFDDLQWADAETLEVVRYLADNVASAPVLVVASARNDSASSSVRALTALGEQRVATLVGLSRLAPQQVLRMTRCCLGDLAVPAEVVQLVSDRAEGLPFFVEELLAGLENEGALVRQGDNWLVNRLIVQAPTTFADSVQRRFDSLSDSEQDVLLSAALLGRRIDADLLTVVLEVGRLTVDNALQAAAGRMVLERHESGLRFRHALTRDALLARVSAASRIDRAAKVLDKLLATAPLDVELTEVLAGLAETAGRDDLAATQWLKVADRAVGQGALTSAESAQRRALRLARRSEIEIHASEALAHSLALVGQVDEALSLGTSLISRFTADPAELDPDGARRRSVHLSLARAAVASTDWTTATGHLDAAAALDRGGDSAQNARLDSLRTSIALGEGRLDDAGHFAESAVALAERAGDPDLLCEALLVHGRYIRAGDLDAAERCFDRARTAALRAGLSHQDARATAELGFIDAWRNGSSQRLLEARDLAAACGAPETEAVTENALAAAAWFCGDADALRSHATAALNLSRRYRLGVMVPSALMLLAGAHAMRGDAVAMEAALAEAAPLIADEPTQLIARHAHCRAVCALAADDLGTARAEFAAAAEILRDRQAATIPPMAIMYVLLAAVDGDDPATAQAGFEGVRELPVPVIAAALSAATAILEGRAGNASEATTHMEGALRELAGNRFLQAVIARVVSPCAISAGWGDPAAWLTTALATFEAQRLPAPARACRSILRELGKISTGHVHAPTALTQRELEVLGHVSEGLTNKAIAERMFVSVRTVDKHVERLLAKTGSDNRAQLATYAIRQRIET